MQIRNMRELAAGIRAERKRLGLSQAALAERAGVGRDWIIGLEKGKSTAEIGLILRTLRALGLRRIGMSRVHTDSASLQGMLHQVSYLVKVEEVDAK